MWTVCIDSIYVNEGRWTYTMHSDTGDGTGNCTSLGTGSISPATDPQPTQAQVAQYIACRVGDSVKLKATGIVYTCSPPPPGTEDNTAVIAFVAVGITLAGLYYLKKRRMI